MKNSLQQVYDKLVIKGRKGVTFDDFPRGKELRKRISELRQFCKIQTIIEQLPSGCRRARYFLV